MSNRPPPYVKLRVGDNIPQQVEFLPELHGNKAGFLTSVNGLGYFPFVKAVDEKGLVRTGGITDLGNHEIDLRLAVDFSSTGA